MYSEQTEISNLPLSAFGDVRTIELSPIIQCSFEFTVDNKEIGTKEITGSGTVSQATAMAIVSTGTTTNSSAEWETKKHAKYRAGLGGLFRGTALYTPGTAGTEQMIGIADVEGVSASHRNGFGVGYSGTVFGFLRWRDDVLTVVPQADWNRDKMDGTGKSGMTLVQTNLNVYFIQFQYLGAGAINLWVEDDKTGLPILVHTELYANKHITPSVYNPNFHMMIHVSNNATTSNVSMKSASMAYFIEGKSSVSELQQPQFSTSKIQKLAVSPEVALFTVRNKLIYAGKSNFLDILLENVTAAIEAGATNNLGEIRVVRNAVLGGVPMWNDIEIDDSMVEIDVVGTTVTGGKELFYSPLAGKNDRIGVNLIPYDIIIAPGESVTLACSSASAATINGSLLWRELF